MKQIVSKLKTKERIPKLHTILQLVELKILIQLQQDIQPIKR